MDGYKIKKYDDYFYVVNDEQVVCSTDQHQVAKYVYYGPLLHRTLKTIKKLLVKINDATSQNDEKTIVSATLSEISILISILDENKRS